MSKKPDVAEEVPEPQRKPQAALPPPTDEVKAGEYIPFGEGASTIEDEHTTGIAGEIARGARNDDLNLSEITTDWVLKRLVREATDFGTRTRQTGRIKALELIGEHLGMWGEIPEGENERDLKRIRELPRAERLARIKELAAKMGGDKVH